jgi:hypothetical protein
MDIVKRRANDQELTGEHCSRGDRAWNSCISCRHFETQLGEVDSPWEQGPSPDPTLAVLLLVASWCSVSSLCQLFDPWMMRHPINAAATAVLFSAPAVIFGAVYR